MQTLKVSAYLFANLVVSITIILLNKWIYSHSIFPNITLSMIHFIITFMGLHVCKTLHLFNIKPVRVQDLLCLALCFCGFVVFTNLSLEYNSVGTFQVAKMLTTPTVVLIQMLYYKKTFSVYIKLTMLPIILGVTLCFLYDIKFNIKGAIFALLGVMVTSFYQVLVNSKQTELQLDSMQLLYYQAPMSVLILCFCIPVLEPQVITEKIALSGAEVGMILVSGLAALCVNLTTYWIIGKTSPLTYNMLGHSKFIFITLGGCLLFHDKMAIHQWGGVLLTLFGVFFYAHLKIKEQEKFVHLPLRNEEEP